MLAVIFAMSFASPAAAQDLVRAINGNPYSFDPHKVYTAPEFEILYDLYEGLVSRNGAGELVPGVANDWSVTSDGLRYTFQLRPSAKWSDGSQVVAEDFKASLERLMTPGTAAPYASLFEIIESVVAADDTTLTIKLANPTAYFPSLLALPAAFPIHGSLRESEAFTSPAKFVGNGAYQLDYWRFNDRAELVRVSTYIGDVKPAFKRVIYVVSEDENTCVRRFQSDELDTCPQLSTGLVRELGPGLGAQLRIVPGLASYYLSLNTNDPVLNNRDVRRALDLAIDRQTLANDTLQGLFSPMESWVPTGFAGYPPAPVARNFAKLTKFQRLQESIQLMTNAGYTPDTPLTLSLAHSTLPDEALVMQEIARMWEPIGVRMEREVRDFASHYAHLGTKQGYQIAAAGWIADFVDPLSFVGLGSNAASSTPNYTNFSDPVIETLLDNAESEPDPQQRMVLLSEAEQRILDSHAHLSLVTISLISLVSDRIGGWQDNPLGVNLSKYLTPNE